MTCQRCRWIGRWGRGSAFLLVSLSSTAAHADPARAIRVIAATDSCPSPSLVAQTLARLLPEFAVATSPSGGGGTAVQITDLGLSFRVRVAGSDREFTDWQRRCDERAEMAGIFVALVLRAPAPPSSVQPASETSQPAIPRSALPASPRTAPSLPPPPRRPAPPRLPSPPPASIPEWQRSMELGAAALVAIAPGSSASTSVSPGAEIGTALLAGNVTGHVGADLSVDLMAPSALDFPATRVRLTRIPTALALRAGLQRGALSIDAILGATMTPLLLQGLGPAPPMHTVRLDLAARVGASARWRLSPRLQPFLAVRADASLNPYELVVARAGVIGRTPGIWIECAAGAATDLW